ncbi:glycoside hydrolase family 36 protein [Cohnella herbarum]|uniref:Alpha-galactosidase n=1 Tax=Cohnella herbarum TaxID=2728023 RepID=A0A7Z2VP94_9BACL|nr:glycoside hydrolase family 36 protein [Cohnella herbarum]QJD86575.1 alpha-galactosidase [Cohnella herbarum]
MNNRIAIEENGISLLFDWTDGGDVRLLHLSRQAWDEQFIGEEKARRAFRMVEAQVTGEDQDDHHGSKHLGTMPAKAMKYVRHADIRNAQGRKLEIVTEGGGLRVSCHYQLYDGIPVVRSWTEIENVTEKDQGLEYVSSFALTGIAKEGSRSWDDKTRVYLPHNAWCGEYQWKSYGVAELGLNRVYDFSMKRISCQGTGTWSTSEFLPMGCVENEENGEYLLWQIEHNGSWQWELSDVAGYLYLRLSGPTENENGWWKKLAPGETFVSVPAAVCLAGGSIDEAFGAMTAYRRAIRRPHPDNERLPVVFNDYMNCLNADPDWDKEMPLIEAAARAGCEYYCVDAGWYGEGSWWDSVGEWMPSERRFPGGMKPLLEHIRSRGMIPGLWLELEVMGIHCAMADQVDDAWFFMRHGKRVIDHGRYQLDYRNPEVIRYADSVIDRVVREYGAGYIKMDYNINAGIGTERQADSFGDGLLGHNRAYVAWIERVLNRYPGLVIESCASGGMRADYALLSKLSLHSATDQMDYRKNAVIAAAAPTAATPEQIGIWAYPSPEGDAEETAMNLVNAMLMRICVSGRLDLLNETNFELVRQGIEVYKELRETIRFSEPFWPLGLPAFGRPWMSLGLQHGDKRLLAVWRMQGEESSCAIPIEVLPDGGEIQVRCVYPAEEQVGFRWDDGNGVLLVDLAKAGSARLFEIATGRAGR